MNKFTKIILGFITILPIIYLCFFFYFMINSFMGITSGVEGAFNQTFNNFETVMVFHIGTMFLSFILMAFYIIHLIKFNNVKQEQKIIWAILISVIGIISMPIYWYFNIWQENWIGE